MQYNSLQYNTMQYNTIQYNTIQYNEIRYYTINCGENDPSLALIGQCNQIEHTI